MKKNQHKIVVVGLGMEAFQTQYSRFLATVLFQKNYNVQTKITKILLCLSCCMTWFSPEVFHFSLLVLTGGNLKIMSSLGIEVACLPTM